MSGVQRFAIAVAGVLLDESKRVLLIHERAGGRQFGLPGGLVQDYDTPDETLVREFELQTGIEVAIDHVVGIRYRLSDQSLLVIAYRCRLMAGSARSNGYGEIDQVGWFDSRSLPSPMSAWVEPAIEAASLGGRGMVFAEPEGEKQRRRRSTGRRPTT